MKSITKSTDFRFSEEDATAVEIEASVHTLSEWSTASSSAEGPHQQLALVLAAAAAMDPQEGGS